MGVYLPFTTKLPSAYQEVEYIQSSGTQYINLGWYATSNYCRIEANVTPYTGTQNWSVFWGMINTASDGYSLHTNNSTWYANLGSSNNINLGVSFSSGTNLNLDFTVNSGSYSLNLNGSTTTGSYSGSIVQNSRPFYLFAYDEQGSTTWRATMKVYSFKLYSSANTLVRDLVPCYRKSDGVIGLYDLVTNQFYTNSGTGTFSKGADVTAIPLKNAYIGEYYEYSYTFKGKTAAQIGSERTTQIGTIAVNTNGLTGTSGSDVVVTKSIPSLTNAKKIIVTSTIVGQSVTNTAGNTGIGKGTGWGTGYVTYQVYGSQYNGMKVAIGYNGTDYKGNSVGNATGTTYKPTLTIDLVAKTVTGVVSGFSNSTYTLTNAQVADIKTYEYITCYALLTLSTISDVSIKIEY